MKNWILPFLMLVFGDTNATKSDISIPSGWRIPSSNELSFDWRMESPSKYARTSADFDGDGLLDSAQQVLSVKGNVMAIIVDLSSRDGDPMVLEQEDAALEVIGIGVLHDRDLNYLCRDRDGECGVSIKVKSDTLMVFREGSSARLLVWDACKDQFDIYWSGD